MKINNIKAIRKRKGYSQIDLAEGIGLDRSFLSQIETGKAKMPEEYIEKLCIFLDSSENEIFGEEKSKKIDGSVLNYAIEIIDSVTDASDLTKKQRLNLINHAYRMVEEALEKKLTPEQLELEVKKLKQEIDKEVKETQEHKKGILSFIKKLST